MREQLEHTLRRKEDSVTRSLKLGSPSRFHRGVARVVVGVWDASRNQGLECPCDSNL